MAVAQNPPGYGHDSLRLVTQNITTNVGNTNVTIPTSGSFAQPLTMGFVRVFTTTLGVNATCKVAAIIGTDSTNANNQVQVYGGDGSASPAGVGIDESIFIRSATTFSSINVVVNVATNNCVHEVHISGNSPRADSF
jgi:hypothetical protein